MKITYKKLQSYIKESLPPIDFLREKIIFHAFEVETVTDLGGGDYELDIKVLPDRAGDAKDEQGMAREVAALLGYHLYKEDVYDPVNTPQMVVSPEKISELLGRTVTQVDISVIFDAYHYQYRIEDGVLVLSVPPWRSDINTVYDLCDEIGRFLGYETIPAQLPKIMAPVDHAPEYLAMVSKRNEMVAKGYYEVMTYSLVKKGDFQVAKGPKGKDFLRVALLPGLQIAYQVNKQNEALLPTHQAKLFEIGKVFPKTGEELHIAWIDEKGNQYEEILAVSTATLSEALSEKGSALSSAPSSPTAHSSGNTFIPWSEFPFMTRDIAAWVPQGISPEEIITTIKQHGTPLLVGNPWLFDSFSKDEKISYGYRMVFQSYERTLTDDELLPIMQSIADAFTEKGWEVR